MFRRDLALKAVAFGAVCLGLAQAGLIPASYGSATNGTTKWQSLGKETIMDGEKTNSNNGVFWSINGSEFVNNVFQFEEGDSVVFRFDIYKEYWGVHSFDALEAWIDTDQNGVFENDEILIKDQWNFNKQDPYSTKVINTKGINEDAPNSYYKDADDWYYDNNRKNTDRKLKLPNGTLAYNTHYFKATSTDPRVYANSTKEFYSEAYTFSGDGDFYLRARVTCSADLNGGGYQPYPVGVNKDWEIGAIGDKSQGETENYHFTVTENVPEPTLLSLLGFGLLGLFAVRRKK